MESGIYLGLLIVLSLLVCFRGRQLFLPIIGIIGFITGFTGGIYLLNNDTMGIIISIVIGLVCGCLATFIFKLGVFVCGVCGGFTLGQVILEAIDKSNIEYATVICAVFGLVIGFLAVKWCNVFITICTAAIGSIVAALTGIFIYDKIGTDFLSTFQGNNISLTIQNVNRAIISNFEAGKYDLTFLIVALALFLVGIILQATGKKGKMAGGEQYNH